MAGGWPRLARLEHPPSLQRRRRRGSRAIRMASINKYPAVGLTGRSQARPGAAPRPAWLWPRPALCNGLFVCANGDDDDADRRAVRVRALPACAPRCVFSLCAGDFGSAVDVVARKLGQNFSTRNALNKLNKLTAAGDDDDENDNHYDKPEPPAKQGQQDNREK